MSSGPAHPRITIHRPMQVRFFHERNLEALEKAINQWLSERSDREIVDIRQSVVGDPKSGSDREVVVSIWYLER